MNHPAKYTDRLIPLFAELLQGRVRVLDPFAGTGKLAAIKAHGWTGIVICNEIEPEWVETSPYPVDMWHLCDAAHMGWAEDESFDAICTSPTYGNRMADHHNAKDGSRRITYRHCIGRTLHPGNTGAMQWGAEYRIKHRAVYKECARVLKPGGILVLNVSDHVRKGKVVPVADWHRDCITAIGFALTLDRLVPTPRMRYGANGGARVAGERVMVFEKKAMEGRRWKQE